jgi:hypothetical protein
MSEISFWLDYYDDIYSDFDPRKYHKRRLSEDFVDEMKASIRYRQNHITDMILLLPPQQRNAEIEKEIVTSLKEQFSQRYQVFATAEKRILKRGVLLLLSGLAIMAADSLLTYKGYGTYFTIALRILMEPASWFMVWTGLDGLLYDYRQAKKETSFYRFAMQLQIRFKDL